MTDMVPNLLRLSSEVPGVTEFWELVADLIQQSLHAESVAVVQATPPEWSLVCTRGVGRGQVPLELAAESLANGFTAGERGWFAGPLLGESRSFEGNSSYVLLVRSPCKEAQFASLCNRVSDALAIVLNRVRAEARADRLQTILAITHEWHQTNEMTTLLMRMAEAATRLLEAERASIFLWDRPNKTIVGRPALGVASGELRLPDHVGIVGQVIQTGEPRRVSGELDAREIDRAVDRQTGYRTRTILCVPLVSPRGERLGAFEVLNKKTGAFSYEDQRALVELASYAAVALQNTQQLTDLLERHERMVSEAARGTELVGESPAIQAVRATVRRIAETDLTVLLLGENGTGKEVVARSIHFGSRRRKHPFLAVNCAALAETLLESELFGHEKGAFTDAHEARPGKFELAEGGTLFLDEIGDMSLAGQAKLLRVLEEKTIVRVGGSRPIHADVRIIAATNQKLAELVRAKRFREDLYFRLNVVSLELPPLRERGDDVRLLADHFLNHFCRRAGRRALPFSGMARKRLEAHAWPGNVRELRNLMERLAYLTSGERIEAEDLAFILSPSGSSEEWFSSSLDLNDATHAFQRKYIQRAIELARGNVSQAAASLGVHRSNLYRKMKQLGMETSELA
ncbi:MAG: sigma-54-dependent Fis family transcriptional regulator [Pirellulales bacterium]|nr:sigma-54-dependent Fis family transcriptional regulator [Pirellulales bacterium]